MGGRLKVTKEGTIRGQRRHKDGPVKGKTDGADRDTCHIEASKEGGWGLL